MGRTSYILKIDNPCQQDWNSMIPNDTGKFCNHCSRTVVDFTRLTDHEIVQMLEKNSGRLCGRLSEKQLNRIMESRQPAKHSRLYRILAGLLFIGTAENSLAVQSTEPIEIVSAENDSKPDSDQQEPFTDSLKNVVKGSVFDTETGEILPFVPIFIKDTKVKVRSDIDGQFKMIIPDSLLTDSITLRIEYVDFKSAEITISRSQLPLTKKIFLQPVTEEIVELGIIVPYKRKWWQRKVKPSK